MLLDGKKVRDELLLQLKEKIEREKLDLTLAIILVGNDSASLVYDKNKIKYSEKVGMKSEFYHLPEETTEGEVIDLIQKLNNDKKVTGIILQSPVPKHINIDNCVEKIDPLKDIDGFTKENLFKLFHNIDGLYPCTPRGIVRLLEYYDIALEGKKVCIVGRGNILGKPLFLELLNKNATPIITHTKTKDLKSITLDSDIIIGACGVKHIIKEDMVKKSAIIVDAGISIVDGVQYGDVDFDNVKDKCLYITPNPGGVGPMTIAMLLENVYKAHKLQENNK